MAEIMSNTTANIVISAGNLAFLAVVVALMLACIVSNGIIVAVFVLERTIRNQANTFVVSLACADLVVATVSMPMWIAGSAPNVHLPFIYKFCIDLLCCSASIYSCALLSLERALKITCPYWYANTATTYRVKIVILFGWIGAVLVGSLSITRGENRNNIPYISFISVFIYGLPVLVISSSYISIFFVAHKHSKNIRRQNRGIAIESLPRLESDAKTAQRLGIFVAVFVICWTPVFVRLWVDTLYGGTPVELQVLASTLPYLNAAINPFLYALGNPAFRKGMKKLYKKKRVSRSTKNSSKRVVETSTFHTNLNNSPTLSRATPQCSPKPSRNEIVSSLLKQHSSQGPYEKMLPLSQSMSATHTLLHGKSRERNLKMWETSV